MPGFSRSDQARLALLARAQRGALIKLPESGADVVALSDNDRLLVWLLRQAVILCRNRADPRLPEVKVEANGKRFRLILPEGWLERRPLTRRALEEEAAHWHAVGQKYAFA
jgi:exopolyphosphatase/guanosine-5'-triphosphate,3'-diphosphate pyrophosphatase